MGNIQASEPAAPLEQFIRPTRHIRVAFWATLTAALILTFALPVATLWRASTNALTARACVWPPTPRAGDQAQALVIVPNQADDAALAGPWATAQVTLIMPDMPGMPVTNQRVEVSGPPQRLDGAAVFMLPITPTMPGEWRAIVMLQTPGRPNWSASFTFQARSDTWADLPLSSQVAGAGNLCAAGSAASHGNG